MGIKKNIAHFLCFNSPIFGVPCSIDTEKKKEAPVVEGSGNSVNSNNSVNSDKENVIKNTITENKTINKVNVTEVNVNKISKQLTDEELNAAAKTTLEMYGKTNISKKTDSSEKTDKLNETAENLDVSQEISIEPHKESEYCDKAFKELDKFKRDEKSNEKIKEDNVEDSKTKHTSIQQGFSQKPHIGLANIGATCYMNATLQCFVHIEKLVDYFKYHYHDMFNIKESLSSSFKSVIDNLWSNDHSKNYFEPKDFKEKISKLNPLFEGIAANDAKDLVNFIIMTLHSELNKSNVNYTNSNIYVDQTNPASVFNAFVEDFKNINRSKISDLFYGVNCNETCCTNCNKTIYNYQTYFFINFPLEEVRKYNDSMYKMCSQNSYGMNNIAYRYYVNSFNTNGYYRNSYDNNFYNKNNCDVVNIYDCFEYDRKFNRMSGENQMYCNHCKMNTDCYMRTRLVIAPDNLILILNRGKGIEFNIKLLFYDEIDLRNFVQYNVDGTRYKLTGVVTHLGESSMSGHFIAYCKDPINGKWNKYNDAIVDEVKDFQKDVIDFGMPYLLFYEKIK